MTMSNRHMPTVTARFDRNPLNVKRAAVCHLVVEVTAPKAEQTSPQTPRPLNLGLVIDASGSMQAGDAELGFSEEFGRTRLDAAKTAGTGVVAFADETITHVAALPLGKGGRHSAMAGIAGLTTRGCTDLNAGWLKGAEHVAGRMATHPECRNRILLLSDGHANSGVTEPGVLADTAAGLRQRGIYTSTVGIGLDYATEQLEVLAEYGGGMMHHAERAEDIVGVILAELSDMRCTVLDDVEIALTVGLNGAAAPASEVSVLGLVSEQHDGVTTAHVGSLVTGASRRVVFRLDLPAMTSPGPLPLTVSAAYRDAEGTERSTASCQVSLPMDQHSKTSLDVELGTIVAEAWLAMVARRAMELNRMEDYREARSWLRKQSTDFNRYCRHLPGSGELVNQMRALCRSSVQPMQESSRKEITLSRYQHLKGVSDQRAAAPAAWNSYLDSK
jgi:Ca-activated chloride channel family protein